MGLAEGPDGSLYISESKEIIDVRLAQAGVRLVAELNQIWCPEAADTGNAVK